MMRNNEHPTHAGVVNPTVHSSVVDPAPEPQVISLPGLQSLRKIWDTLLPKKMLPRHWSILAVAFLAAYVGQAILQIQWAWLNQLQQVGWYRWASGGVLAFFVGYQWYLFVGRVLKRKLGSALFRHQQVGVLAPIVFYAHSVQIGFGMIAALSLVYLINILLGAANPAATGIKSKNYRPIWFVSHIALSFLLVVMMVWHVWIGIYYH